jgi:hypothetical protein
MQQSQPHSQLLQFHGFPAQGVELEPPGGGGGVWTVGRKHATFTAGFWADGEIYGGPHQIKYYLIT